ncbi:zinc finger MYM-type protein 1-like [Anastrepha ludens]|uniref:zinc finger MYM-type protein 1-like n=1 Tax=Anastrepha ludens TaxID=28586 RepID=UPI0023AFA3B7|nr:zinc finger MYM-type protein 1-like [Anastrepha ludens]
MTFLQARAEDVVELKAWLQRDGHKWLHHRSQNEILELMATTVSMEIIEDIRNAEYCSILLDETSDVSRIEQVSVCLRIVSEDLTAKEHFISFFSTSDTKAKTLFDLVEEIFQKYNLPLSKVRGQCYDGASNVSGNISGLQTRILEKESRALYVHCNAHNLNLVVQDAIENMSSARKCIGILREIINFVRDSPKRIAQFRNLQIQAENEGEENLPSLAAYCPTRY